MNTLKTNALFNLGHQEQTIFKFDLLKKYNAYVDGQAKNHTLWWFISLMVHGNLVLAIPAVLIYYYHAPVLVLAVTFTCFFTNLIANMGGSGIKITLNAFFLSLIINFGMLIWYII